MSARKREREDKMLFIAIALCNVPGIGSVTVVLLAGLQIGQIFLAVLRRTPYAPVEDAHDRHRSVECSNGRAECDVIICLDELDVAFV
jgi:hypothetical protein